MCQPDMLPNNNYRRNGPFLNYRALRDFVSSRHELFTCNASDTIDPENLDVVFLASGDSDFRRVNHLPCNSSGCERNERAAFAGFFVSKLITGRLTSQSLQRSTHVRVRAPNETIAVSLE